MRLHKIPRMIAGVDEVGRGPLAGPVYAGAVILNHRDPIEGLRDSKQLTAKQREILAEQIRQRALAFGIGRAEVFEIEEINILQASLLAMQRAINQLAISPKAVWVDGNQRPNIALKVVTIINGDEEVPAISAASIIAKVARDQEMISYDTIYPGYGFAQHKGYATEYHLAQLQKHGPTPIHRRTFAHVKEVLDNISS